MVRTNFTIFTIKGIPFASRRTSFTI